MEIEWKSKWKWKIENRIEKWKIEFEIQKWEQVWNMHMHI